MTDTRHEKGVIRFSDFEVDVTAGELRKLGARLRLQEQPFQVLALLLERPGDVVTREELRERLWQDETFVDFDHGLNKAINKLRDALGDSAQNPTFVETLPRRGYRFIGSVVRPEVVEVPSDPHTAVREDARLLRSWIGVVAALATLALMLYWIRSEYPETSAPSTEKTLLVVLPFDNLGGNAEQDYFSDGLTEEMISQLGTLNPSRLGVIARTSAMHYKNTTKRVDQIAAELGVDYVLEGSVRRADDRLRITAQLILVSDQTHLWAESYDRGLEDVFAIQDDVAERIADSLALELLPRGAGLKPTTSRIAHEAYLRGRFYWNKRTVEGFKRGLIHFTRAVDEDPDYAFAHVGIADSYIMLANYGAMAPSEALPDAMAAAQRALDIAPDLAEALISKTWSEWMYGLDWDAAEKGFQTAMQLHPGHSFSYQLYASYLGALGRHDEAIREMSRARELDPLSLVINSVLGWHYLLAREPDAAIEQCQRTIEMDPGFSRVHSYLGWAYLQKSRYEDAVLELERSHALFGDSPASAAELAHAYAVAGRQQEAREILGTLEGLAPERYVEAILLAKIQLGLGDKDEAFRWLERAFVDRSVHRVRINVDPLLDPLRDDPRFVEISERFHFPTNP